MNEHVEEINENKYLTLLSTNESKEIIKKLEERCSKIRDLIRLITENFMKIKVSPDYNLPLNKTLEIQNMRIVVRVLS